jgi:xanthine dehydrogenase YagR molybdenum-binding subunit
LRNLIEQPGLRALAHFGQFAVHQQVRSNQPANPGRVTGGPSDTAVGDFARAFAAAPAQLDATYTTSNEAHAMMEPHASIAAGGGQAYALVDWSAGELAKTLGIP